MTGHPGGVIDAARALAANAPYTMPMGTTCAVHVHTSWVPIERHHIMPLAMGGPDKPANLVSVCCNGHYAIHEFMRQLILTGGQVPWEVARHFGPKVRYYAIVGWERAGRPTRD